MDEDAGSGSDSDSGSHDDGSHAASERDMKNMPECVMNPKKASCSSYEYPEDMARDDIASLCDAMPYMIACGLWEACEAGDLPDSPYCHPFTVLATGCNDEGMSGMEGCAGYNAMCVDGTRVAQCRERRPVPSMLQTTETQVSSENWSLECLSCVSSQARRRMLLRAVPGTCMSGFLHAQCAAQLLACLRGRISVLRVADTFSWHACVAQCLVRPTPVVHLALSQRCLWLPQLPRGATCCRLSKRTFHGRFKCVYGKRQWCSCNVSHVTCAITRAHRCCPCTLLAPPCRDLLVYALQHV